MELEKKQNPGKHILPAAFVYYHMADPMIEGEEGITEEEIELQIKKQLRVTGIVNSDAAVLQSLDKTHAEKSDVIPVEYKKDGSLSSRSSVMTGEEMEVLQQYTKKKIEALGKEILEGNIAINPKSLKKKDVCTFCKFQGICEFDSNLQGFEKKELEDPETEELWKKIRAVAGKQE